MKVLRNTACSICPISGGCYWGCLHAEDWAEQERLAAEIVRLKSQLWASSHVNTIMARNLGAEQRGTDAIVAERDRLARENARLAVELEATIERASQVAFEYLQALNYSVMAFNVRAVIRSRVATKVAATP